MSLQAAADLLARHGREGDSVLVHMSPDEVRGLQQLAEMHGTTLTINPHTGMPEALNLKGFLKAIAPIALGAFLGPGAFGISGLGLSAGTAGLITGGVTTALTGSLEKGLMAGLGAYGGAGMAYGAEGLGQASMASQEALAQNVAENIAKETGGAMTAEQIAAQQVAPTATSAVQEGLSQAIKNPSALYDSMGKDAWKYTAAAAAPVAQEMSRTQMPDVPKYTPTAAIHPKYAYRDQEGNVQFVDLPGVKMEDWKPEQSVSDYVRSLVAEPTYEDEIKRAAGGGVMTADELAYQNDPVIRMAGGGVSDAAVKDWFASNAGATDAQIAQAMDQFKVSPEQVSRVTGVGLPQVQQRYEAAIAPQVVSGYTEGVAGPGGTTSQYGSGYLGIYDDLTQRGITAPELFNAPGYKGWSQPAISHAYDVAAAINKFDPRTDAVTPSDKEWVNFMDTNKFSVRDIAQATGLSQAEVQRRYDAAKVKPTIKIGPAADGSIPPGTVYDNGAYGPYGSGTAVGTDYLGRTTSIATPGDKIYNPDGSVSVVPNVPGRPYGGFTGMDQVKSAYTAGGGNLGQVLAPTKTYQNTGLSAAAYDYLMGKGPSPKYVQKPPIAANSFKDISNPTKAELLTYKGKSKVWQDGKMIDNPYVSGEKTEEKKTTTTTTTEEARPAKGGLLAHYAEGGLSAAYAAGGITGEGNLDLHIPLDIGGGGGGGYGGGGGSTGVARQISNPGLGGFAGYNNTAGGGFGTPNSGGTLPFPERAPAFIDDFGMGDPEILARNAKANAAARALVDTSPTGGLQNLANSLRGNTLNAGSSGGQNPMFTYAEGGMTPYAAGGQYDLGGYSDGGRLLRGPGDGVSDSIPATIGGKRPARLADGEFVVPARIVSEIGNGSTEAGARKLYAMMERVQQARKETVGKGRSKVAKNTRADKYLPV